MLRFRLLVVLSGLAVLTACAQAPREAAAPTGLAAVTVRAGAPTTSQGLRPQGTPSGATRAELRVLDSGVEVRFDATGHVAINGERPSISLPGGAAVTIYLPTGRTYAFELTAMDAAAIPVAYGERTGLTITSNAAVDVDISLRSFVGQAQFLNPPASLQPGEQTTLYLMVSPPGTGNLWAPESDWSVLYNVNGGSVVLNASGQALSSQLGVTVKPNAGASSLVVTATVHGLKSRGVEGDVNATATIQVGGGASAGGVGADFTAPTVSIDTPASLQAGVSSTLTGHASDDRGVSRVEVYSGTALLGTANLNAEAWTFAFVPVAGAQQITAIAYDAAGNAKRAEATVTANEASGTSGLDTSFDGDGRVNIDLGGDALGTRVAVQPDGKILVAGRFNGNIVLTRVNPDGTPDTSFNGTGKVTLNPGGVDAPHELLLPGSRIVVVFESDRSLGVLRLLGDGKPDSTFNGGNKVTAGSIEEAAGGIGASGALLPDGSIIVSAAYKSGAYNYDTAMVKIGPSGALDTSFGGYQGEARKDIFLNAKHDYATATAAQSSGKIVVAGYATPATDSYQAFLARFSQSGALDTGFATGGKTITLPTDVISGGIKVVFKRVLVLADDSIVALGEVTTATGSNLFVERRSASGALDTSFGTNGRAVIDLGTYDFGNALAVDAAGRILVIGNVSSASGTDPYGDGKAAVARLTASGALDTIFATGGKLLLNEAISATDGALDADGRLLVTGRGDPISGAFSFGVARIRP